jgi:hypothetical protein
LGCSRAVNNEATITHPLLDPAHMGWALFYYIAGHSVVGPVLIKSMTGCRGARVEATTYKVSY